MTTHVAGVTIPSGAADPDWVSGLVHTLGAPFHPWVPGATLSESVNRAAHEARTSGFAIRSADDDLFHVWIAQPGRRQNPPLVFGAIPGRDAQLLERLVHAARRLITQDRTLTEQSADVASCLESLTYGLEEQNWLRSLSSHLSLCSLRHTWLDVVRAILPSLRSLIHADAVTVIMNEDYTKALQTPALQSVQCVLTDGKDVVSGSSWQMWRDERTATFDGRSVVQNGPYVDRLIQTHRVHAFCAVPMVHRDLHFGWIAGVKQRASDSDGRPRERLSENEFGTVEAGLMEAAAAMLATHRNNVDLLQDRENLTIGIIRTMGNAIDARDPYTRGHSERVGRYGRSLARAVGLCPVDCDRLYLSGLLHDVGKIGIPDTVLRKPGKLTEEEFAVIKKHPEIGARIVSALPQLADLLPGILHHHENWDGTGYPHGLVGERIPLMGRILAVADAYDAMTSNRPYRDGMPRSRALEILSTNAGTQWDKQLVQAFLAIPVEQLNRDSFDGSNGWSTDEMSLRGGTAALLGGDLLPTTTYASSDDALPADIFAIP